MSSTDSHQALGLEPSFGFGDRLGVATPGHLEALIKEGGPIRGIFSQQSIREMARTNRNPDQVMGCAARDLDAANFSDPWGSDADHLKTPENVDYMADAGFIFYTIDPSDHVDQKADDYKGDLLEEKFNAVKNQVAWIDRYLGQTTKIPSGPSITFDEVTIKKAAVKYGKALVEAIKLAEYIKEAAVKRGQAYEIEVSVDETDQPTALAEHYIIADQLKQAGVEIISLAPRFIGEMEKGVDYKGDLGALEKSLEEHNAIAEHLGPYKLSLHSGSDKLSMYELFARATKGRFHVKTAGTSYLEALRAVLRHDEALFRDIVAYSRDRYETDKATYHVSATLEGVPAPESISDIRELESEYLELWEDVEEGKGFTKPGRQILHTTFGSVLTHEKFGPAISKILVAHPETYKEVLADHFGRHLRALCRGLPNIPDIDG